MAKRIPVLCVVGPSGSGKTTLMEGLIKELSRRGYRVATIKHAHHPVELDQRGKDTWRHRQAGAAVSVISSGSTVAVFSEEKRELAIEDLRARFIHDADLILAEGYKDSNCPKIVVVGNGRWSAADWIGVKAVVSDRHLDVDVPVFHRSDVTGIVRFLEHEFLERNFIEGGEP